MKTENEKKFDSKAKEYEEKFGEAYPIFTTGYMSFEEHIDVINNAIKSGKPVAHKVEKGIEY